MCIRDRRRAAPAMSLAGEAEMGAAFIDAVNQGLVTANPPDWGEPPDPNGICLLYTSRCV